MSDYILDTSNHHPKIKPEDQKEEFLVYYNLMIENVEGFKEFKIHGLIWAKDSKDAYDKMPTIIDGINYGIEKGEVIGAVKDEQRREIHDKLHDIGGGIVLP